MTPPDVDVLIIGAGLSGIGVAWHLADRHPQRTLAIWESRGASGGTWDLFRYPGIRSDSDLATLSYEFRPWMGDTTLAGGPEILAYLRETAREAELDRRISYHHRAESAEWSTEEGRWTITGRRTDTDQSVTITARWLFSAGGYYNYERAYRPEFPGEKRFAGTIVHPQFWPDDLNYDSARVVVVGSGATAVTLVPAMAERAAHVTMLQRSPTYIVPLPSTDRIGHALRRHLGRERGHRWARRKNIGLQRVFYAVSRRHPRAVRRLIRRVQGRYLPPGFDAATHLTPSYDPWDQRVCAAPDGDLFNALARGSAEIVTDRIETFDETGIRLKSGRHLDADIVVTATGLELRAFGGIQLVVDGRAMKASERLAFKGMLLSGVPNFAYAIGYINASWTLKVDLVAEHLCRILDHADSVGADRVMPLAPDGMATRPLLDFTAGYVQRALDVLPKQGTRPPWTTSKSYAADVRLLRQGPVDDPALLFERTPTAAEADRQRA